MPSGAPAIPVEAILKLTLDQTGAKSIQDFMDHQERSWAGVAEHVGKIGDGIEGMTRTLMGLAGVAGVGALAQNFLGTSTAGSNVALAAGHAEGGAGTWHPYAQGLLGDQAKTGVPANEIAQGLILALQDVGGSPTPNQAAVLGGLLAGYGQTVGLTPAQVAQALSPMLQAANKPLTDLGTASMLATITSGLTAYPGSQAAPAIGTISALATAQGLGTSGHADVAGLTALTNVAAQGNSIWRNQAAFGSAASGISGGLQSAYTNPSAEAFMTMAGISYDDQRAGMTPANVEKITAQAAKMFPDPETRDMVLRSMFGGIPGADLLETYGAHSKQLSKEYKALQSQAEHPQNQASQLGARIGGAQARTTPQSELNKLAGGAFGWIEQNPLTALLGAGALWKGPGLVGKLLGKAKGALGGAEDGTAEGAAAGAGGSAVEGDLLETLLGAGTMGAGTLAAALGGALVSPDSISVPGSNNKQARTAVLQALSEAKHKFGSDSSSQAEKWMWNQFGFRESGPGSNMPRTNLWDTATDHGEYGHGSTVAQQLLQKVFQQFSTGQDPITTFAQASQALLQAAQDLKGKNGFSAYHPGGGSSSQDVSMLGASGLQAMDAMGASVEYAALSGGGSGGTISTALTGGSGGTQNVSLASGGAGAATGAGWQSCTLTWYDPALGGTNSSNGAANPHSATASGQPYSPTAMTCAAPPQYAFGTQIQFAYGNRSVTCTVNDRGGAITGEHFDLARAPAQALGMISAGVVTAKFKVLTAGHGKATGSSSGSGAGTGVPSGMVQDAMSASGSPAAGVSQLSALSGGGGGGAFGAGSQPIHVHVHVDGRKIQTSRVLRGHKR